MQKLLTYISQELRMSQEFFIEPQKTELIVTLCLKTHFI